MVRVIGPKDPRDKNAINTTSRSKNWSRDLSPFFLGPVPLYIGAASSSAQNVENAWQYSKVYPGYVDEDGNPHEGYFAWARRGWENKRAVRYPMGKGAKPLYSYWAGEKMPYVKARAKIYVPLYSQAVVNTGAFQKLLQLYRDQGEITLWDFDGYDHHALGMSLEEVLNDPTRIMGHAFVLAAMLERMV